MPAPSSHLRNLSSFNGKIHFLALSTMPSICSLFWIKVPTPAQTLLGLECIVAALPILEKTTTPFLFEASVYPSGSTLSYLSSTDRDQASHCAPTSTSLGGAS